MDILSPGTTAPDFTLPPSPEQPLRRLSSLRGRPVILAFSALDWDPARAEGLAQTGRLLHQAGFDGELLGLSGEDADRFGVAGKSALFLLDDAGAVRWRQIAAPGLTPRAEDLLAGLDTLAPSASTGPADKSGLTRREFVAAALGVALALALAPSPARAQEAAAPAPALSVLPPPSSVGTVPVTLRLNGADHTLQIEPRVTLLDALRERIGLTGSKKGCDHGQCGACTVHVDGKRINSCLALAIAQQGKEITTIEGLASGDTLHPVQAAFIKHDGFQCGYCTPGQIMSAAALLREPVGPDDADVRENMSGNLCRCGAYTNIVAAIQDVRKGSGNAPV